MDDKFVLKYVRLQHYAHLTHTHTHTQISDIHLSYVNNMAVAKDFSSFCQDTITIINPSLVLVTGDLTHGKYPDERWSRQFEEEWIMYGKVLERCGVKERLPWLDIRGNHGEREGVGGLKMRVGCRYRLW